jgi:hypothetical protein
MRGPEPSIWTTPTVASISRSTAMNATRRPSGDQAIAVGAKFPAMLRCSPRPSGETISTEA